MSKVTYSKQKKWKSQVVRQTGVDCFHCGIGGTELNPLQWAHLNGKNEDSRPENLAFMCQPCNNKMKFNFDMILQGNAQLEENEKAVLVCERKGDDSGTESNITSSEAIHQINYNITEQFYLEHTITDDILYLRDAINAIVNLCNINNGTGSQAAVYRYTDSLTNSINGKYTIYDYHGKNAIRRRTEN